MTETANATQKNNEKNQEADRQRSPAYPSISLPDAIEKTRLIYHADKGSATPADVVASHWTMSAKSSGFMQALASILRYGLLEELEGKPRRVKPSKDALDILLLPDSDPKHQAAVRRAALTPKLFKDLWARHGKNLPSDHTLVHQLVTDAHFRPPAATDAIKQYKTTITFAKLSEDDTVVKSEDGRTPEIGDYVQWESQGMARFEQPKRVTGKTSDGEWLFVEDSKTGIPASQATRVDPPPNGKAVPAMSQQTVGQPVQAESAPPVNPNYTPSASPSIKQDVFTGDTGDIIVRWPAVVSANDIEDVEAWLDMLKRKIKRSVQSAEDKQN